ncbi:hypothetical protein B0H10DRAFT_1817694 [Mycena sp. CBHHK59/15]|nr:hypothetical protein B0H10DRAFT_1817694 [Mycena sp. CBHHK59/15]
MAGYTKALTLQKSATARTPLYHDAIVQEQAIPPLKQGQVLVKMGAVAFNHRDLWIRKGLYPRIALGSTFGADGAGTVIAAADKNDPLLQQRVFLTPMRGWESGPNGPESNFGILGGTSFPLLGTFSEYVVVDRQEVILTPSHLDDVQIAAWPLAGLTAWRAVVVLAKVKLSQNVLITGIGGGVALIAMQICIAKGASVYVTSGTEEKIEKAVAHGAKGGAIYKNDKWAAQIVALIKKTSPGHPTLDSIIDSGGGDIMGQTSQYMKFGGKVVCYGMTANPKITLTMREVLRSQHLLGTMMGSRQDMQDATKFLSEKGIIPVVSHVLSGLEAAEDGFNLMQKGEQFGKIVIQIKDQASPVKSNL